MLVCMLLLPGPVALSSYKYPYGDPMMTAKSSGNGHTGSWEKHAGGGLTVQISGPKNRFDAFSREMLSRLVHVNRTECAVLAHSVVDKNDTKLAVLNISQAEVEWQIGASQNGPWYQSGQLTKSEPLSHPLWHPHEKLDDLLRLHHVHSSAGLARYKQYTSMLHVEVLFLLGALAQCSHGAAFEVGTNRGGGTLMMGIGASLRAVKSDAPAAEAEAAPASMRVYSFDMMDFGVGLAVTHLGLASTVELIGVSEEAEIWPQLDGRLLPTGSSRSGHCLGLVFIDADGNPLRKWNALKHLVCRQAYLVLDDYTYSGKSTTHLQGGQIVQETPCAHVMGVYGWGTLFIRIDCRHRVIS